MKAVTIKNMRLFLGILSLMGILSAAPAWPTQREQAVMQQEWLKLRLERILPPLMQRHNVDFWLVICREYNEDPVFDSLVSPTVFAARRTTILAFHQQPDGSVKRYALGGGSNGGLYEVYRDPGSSAKELYLDAQWLTLAKLVQQANPKAIAINVSDTHAFSDGLTQGLHDRLKTALGPELWKRVTTREELPLQYIQLRLPEMLPTYRQMMEMAHSLIARAFSNEVITPGVTTDEDVVWWLRQQLNQMGLSTWFQPSVTVQRPGMVGLDYLNRPSKLVIERGDVLHTDFGISALRLATDTQHMGYVLKEGEEDVPAGLKAALAKGNKMQDIVMANLQPPRSGNEILLKSLVQIRKEGIKGTVYSHPIGDHGHGAGPLIGLWDRQEEIKGRGEVPVLADTWYSIELNCKVPVPEWNNQEVSIGMEEDAVVDGQGRATWVLRRQAAFHVIR
jgi:hypothetical protein